jgi:hypothetical protein
MFGDLVCEKAFANNVDRILLIDNDHLDETTNYSANFLAQGFEVVEYTDDLSFRIEYEEKLKNTGDKIVVVAHAGRYIPYDIRRKFRSLTISLANLFPLLSVEVLREKSALDLDLLCLAYPLNYDDLRKRNQTEYFFRRHVYTKANVSRYLVNALRKLMTFVEEASSYKDWFAIAEEKAKIDILAVKYEIDTAKIESLVADPTRGKYIEIDTSEINRRFQEYALAQFGQLSQIIDKDTPVLISKTMEYAHENSSKFVVIVMDGMSEFDWNIISTSFGEIPYQQTAAFAMIPTTTSISRQCLLSNKYPSQLEEPWKQSKEKAEFIACAKELGYSGEQIGYARGYDAEFSSFVRCAAVIINDVDDIVHAQQQGRLGMFNDITVLANQSKLADTAKRFLTAGYDVYITSDHGNTPCIGLGRLLGTGVEVETKSRRMLVLKDFADKEALLEKYGLIEYPKYYLAKDYDYLICDIGDSFDDRGKDVMTHGGITIDEVVVPFIKIKAVEKNG